MASDAFFFFYEREVAIQTYGKGLVGFQPRLNSYLND